MSGAGVGAALFCLEPVTVLEPTQLGRSRSRLRDLASGASTGAAQKSGGSATLSKKVKNTKFGSLDVAQGGPVADVYNFQAKLMALAELMEEDGGGRSQARRQYRARPTTPAPLAALQRSKVSQDRGWGGNEELGVEG